MPFLIYEFFTVGEGGVKNGEEVIYEKKVALSNQNSGFGYGNTYV